MQYVRTVGSTSVGSTSVGSTSVGSTSVGSTSVGSTSVGSTSVGSTIVVNAGSVGMAYGEPGAYWLLLYSDRVALSALSLRRTVFDQASAAQRIRATGYPQAQRFADENVLIVPTEAEALAVFASLETSLQR